MKVLESKIRSWIGDHRAEGVKLLQRLVQEESIRGQENKGQAIVIEKCRQLGLTLDIWDIDEKKLFSHRYFHSDRTDFRGNPNVVAILRGTGDGKSIILNSHIDVVPAGNLDDWQNEPFSGIIEDGKVYGRGATDMKGGTVSLLLAMEAIISLNIRLKGDVIFQSVIEEESGGAGTLATVLRGYRADAALIPEPTNMKLFPKQQGSMWFRITVKGKAAHGGTRYEGVNAIEKAQKVINALLTLEKERNKGETDPLYQQIPIPFPINIGKINSGAWPSSVPDRAIIEGRMGVSPEESLEEAEVALENCLKELNKQDEWFQQHPVTVQWFGGRWLPGSVSTEHSFMKNISAGYERILQKKPVVEASPWGTDGGILSQVGKIPVVVFGPGTTEVAHDTNEYVEIEKVFQAAEVIALAIVNWCGVDK